MRHEEQRKFTQSFPLKFGITANVFYGKKKKEADTGTIGHQTV